MDKIILVGAGGHAKVIVDTIEKNKNYEIVGFVDVAVSEQPIYKTYRIIATDDGLQKLYDEGICHAFICIGYMGLSSVRENLYKKLKEIGYELPVIIDSSAVLASDVWIGEGTFIGKNAVVNANAQIGKMCIINTAAIIEHESVIDDFTHIAVAAVVCGNTVIGKYSFIGANATIIQNCVVGDGCIIGAGSFVGKDIENMTKIIGNTQYKLGGLIS